MVKELSESVTKRIELIKRAVYTAVFTALVFAATSFIVVSTPATRGFFNLGETMVYTTALLTLDPYIAFIAGGLGSALADIYLGYAYYAMGTFIIKGIEGLLVVLLAKLFRKAMTRWKVFLVLMNLVISVLILVYGVYLYSGVTYLKIYGNTIELHVPVYFWAFLATALALIIPWLGLRVDPSTGFDALALIISGLEMVTGYFLYQVLYLHYDVYVAATEIPVNIGQAVIGLTVALPLAKTLRGMGVEFGR